MNRHIKVIICGVQGYVGAELLRLVQQHPQLQLVGIVARKSQEVLYQELPLLAQLQIPVFNQTELVQQQFQIDVLLLATPAEESIELVSSLKNKATHLIDLSGAFRLPVEQLNHWYGLSHQLTEFTQGAHYGLSPWNTPKVNQIKLIANPGCYATCALMTLIPLLKTGIINKEKIIIDAKSGVSGAGKKLNAELMYCEMQENFFPYKIGKHQHIPEITNALKLFANATAEFSFTTQMLPIARGLAMTIYAESALDNSKNIFDEIHLAYTAAYQRYPLIKFAGIGEATAEFEKYLLALNNIKNTAMTHLMYLVNKNQITIFASIDNLLKGAASQAIENVNALYQFPLETGLLKMRSTL